MEENANSAPPAAEDPIIQLKGEMSRKVDNVTRQISELSQVNALLMEKITAMAPQPQKAAAPADDLTSLMYSDPAKYAQHIEERAEARVLSKIDARTQEQIRTNSIFADIVSEYPELNDKNSELTKKSVEFYNKMSPDEQRNPISYKLAAKEAALELGMKPKSKRPVEEDFMSPGDSASPSQRRRNSTKIDPVTEAWAELLNVDLSNPEIKDRVLARSQRNWNKYATPISSKKGGRK